MLLKFSTNYLIELLEIKKFACMTQIYQKYEIKNRF